MVFLFPMALTGLAAVIDLRTREIPNTIPSLLLATGLVAVWLGWLPITMTQSLEGAGLALLVGLPLFWIGAWGGGDIKLLVGLGAWLGPEGAAGVLIWTAIFGVALALVSKWRKQETFALAPAIAAAATLRFVLPLAIKLVR